MFNRNLSESQRNAVIDASIAANGGAWPDMEGLIRDVYVAHLEEGDVALDVGVNHGGHLIQMANAVGENGRVFGFEAVPDLIARTEELISQGYPHVRERITLFNVAVSDKPGHSKFFFSQFNDSGLSGMARRAVLDEGPVKEIDVTVDTIDHHMCGHDLSQLTFAKFDIEGAELHAFRGAASIFERRPLFCFEWDSTAPEYFHYVPRDMFDFVRSRGYRIFDFFGFEYDRPSLFVKARMWNFLAVPEGSDPAHVLRPSFETLNKTYPSVF